jgi:flagellar hook protein FlgE
VKVAEIAQDFTQGTIEISSNPLDVAIQGDGFLIVQTNQGQLYTRNGQLKTNANNELVTVGGDRVLGFNAENGRLITGNMVPLVIPIGGSVVNRVTSTASFSGTMDPEAAVGTGNEIQSSVLTNGLIDAPGTFPLSSFLATPPINPSGVTNTPSGVGTPAAGVYQYRFTYVDSNGNETPGSTAISVDTTGTGGEIGLANLPAIPTGYAGVNIYRTEAGQMTNFYRVNTTPITGPLEFDDNVADGAFPGNVALNTDSLDFPGVYSYYITYYNQSTNTETVPSALQGPVAINSANQGIRITNIPQPTQANFDEIRIYRSLAGDTSNFYRIAEFAEGQTTFMDRTSDADINTADPTIRLDFNGPKISNDTFLVNIKKRNGADYPNVFNGPGTLTFQASKGDITLPLKAFTVTSTTTVLDLMTFMQQSLGINTIVDNAPSISVANGRLVLEGNAGLENAIEITASSLRYKPTSTGQEAAINLGFSETVQAVGEGSTSEFVVYDSLGIPLTVQITTALERKDDSSTVWRWFATSANNEPLSGNSTVVGTGTITYDVDGNFVDNNADTEVLIQRTITASRDPLSFNLDFSGTNGKDLGITQLDFKSQDGFAPGVLTDFSVTETGEIRGIYSNGIGQTLGQIRMARFTNNAGLEQVGNNLFAEGVNSGAAAFGNPGDSGLGELTAGAVELSNTDIGQNLIELILASTQYRGGARVITAVQELLDELLALRR